MFPYLVVLSTSGEAVDKVGLAIGALLEDTLLHDFHYHGAGHQFSIGHQLSNLLGLIAVAFDEVSEQVAGGIMFVTIFLCHDVTLGSLSSSWAAEDEDNLWLGIYAHDICSVSEYYDTVTHLAHFRTFILTISGIFLY